MKNWLFGKTSREELVEAMSFASLAYSKDGFPTKADGNIPKGWSVVHAVDIGLTGNYDDGDFIKGTRFGSRCLILKNEKTHEIAFNVRGTDDGWDLIKDFLIVLGDDGYSEAFSRILTGIKNTFKHDYNYIFTGHSLGGAAVNQIAASGFGNGFFKNAQYYAFASPQVLSSKVLNIGFDNDIVYNHDLSIFRHIWAMNHAYFVNDRADLRIVPQIDLGAHWRVGYIDFLNAYVNSEYSSIMTRRSSIYYIDNSVNFEINLGFSISKEIFVLGNDHNNIINGSSAKDYIEGFGGNDVLSGGAGADHLKGGAGNDTFLFGAGDVIKGELIDGGSFKGEINKLVGSGILDFRVAKLSFINVIGFDLAGRFVFQNNQIGGNGVAATTTIIGSDEKDELAIIMGSAASELNLGKFTFLNWGQGDFVSILGLGTDETITGSARDDTIAGMGGADTIHAMGGNDTIRGGKGADGLDGGAGNDFFVFDKGDVESGETIDGGALVKGETNTIITAGAVDFRPAAISHINHVTLQQGANVNFLAAQMRHFIVDHAHFDGAGKLQIDVGGGGNNFTQLDIGSSGWTGQVVINGTTVADTIVGTAAADQIYGQNGNDVIQGGLGNDTIYGGMGADQLTGNDGNDVFFVDRGEAATGETIDGGNDNDSFRFLASTDLNWVVAKGGSGNDQFVFSTINLGSVVIDGGGDIGTDVISALSGTDFSSATIIGIEQIQFQAAGELAFKASQVGTSQSLLKSVVGTKGANHLVINLDAGDVIDLSQMTFQSWTTSRPGLKDDFVIFNGADGSERITGTAANDNMYGGFGADTLHGGQGADSVLGDTSDVLAGGAGDDDKLYGEAGDDGLYGSGGNDRLYGGTGNDWMDGSIGFDTLTGGIGADIFQTRTFSGSAEVDHFVDFSHAQGDTIAVDTGGNFGSANVPLYYGSAPENAGECLIYNVDTGGLYVWDSTILGDGLQLLAVLDNKAMIYHSDLSFA